MILSSSTFRMDQLFFRRVKYSTLCGIYAMWNIRCVEYTLCGIYAMWNIRYVEYTLCGIYAMWNIRYVDQPCLRLIRES